MKHISSSNTQYTVYEKAFIDKVFSSIGLDHSMNVLEFSYTPLSGINAYNKYGCLVEQKNKPNIDGGIFDKAILFNIVENDFLKFLEVAQNHTDGQILFISTKTLSNSFLKTLNESNPKSQAISQNYSLFIF